MKDLRALDDYLSGHMSDADAAGFEEALFDGAAATPSAQAAAGEAGFVDRLARIVAWLVDRGLYQVGITRREVDQLAASGRRVQIADFGRPGTTSVTLARETEIFVMRFEVDLHGVDRVDIEVEAPGRGIIKTFPEVRFDPEDGALYGCCTRALAELAFAVPQTVARLYTTRAGHRDVGAVYEVTAALE